MLCLVCVGEINESIEFGVLLVCLTHPPTQSFVPLGNLNESSTRVNVGCHTHLCEKSYSGQVSTS